MIIYMFKRKGEKKIYTSIYSPAEISKLVYFDAIINYQSVVLCSDDIDFKSFYAKEI